MGVAGVHHPVSPAGAFALLNAAVSLAFESGAVVAGFAAAGTFTLSTVPEVRAATTGPYLVLVGCGVALLIDVLRCRCHVPCLPVTTFERGAGHHGAGRRIGRLHDRQVPPVTARSRPVVRARVVLAGCSIGAGWDGGPRARASAVNI